MFSLNLFMKILFNQLFQPLNYKNQNTNYQPASNPAFGSAKARKLIEKVLQADSNNFRGINATFEEVVKACTEMVLLIAQWDIPDEKYKNLLRKEKSSSDQ